MVVAGPVPVTPPSRWKTGREVCAWEPLWEPPAQVRTSTPTSSGFCTAFTDAAWGGQDVNPAGQTPNAPKTLVCPMPGRRWPEAWVVHGHISGLGKDRGSHPHAALRNQGPLNEHL